MRVRVQFRPPTVVEMASDTVASTPLAFSRRNRKKIPCVHEWKHYTFKAALPTRRYPGLICKHCGSAILVPKE
jgi:hypothetical protein